MVQCRNTLVDLVPRRHRFYAGLFFAGVVVVAILEGLYAIMPRLASHTTDGRVAAFDLETEGSLAVWVSSTTLLAAAVVTLLIATLLRSNGRRSGLWFWAAGCWLTLSIDESASLHEAFKELMSHAAGTRIVHDGTIWWVAAYFVVLATTGCR